MNGPLMSVVIECFARHAFWPRGQAYKAAKEQIQTAEIAVLMQARTVTRHSARLRRHEGPPPPDAEWMSPDGWEQHVSLLRAWLDEDLRDLERAQAKLTEAEGAQDRAIFHELAWTRLRAGAAPP